MRVFRKQLLSIVLAAVMIFSTVIAASASNTTEAVKDVLQRYFDSATEAQLAIFGELKTNYANYKDKGVDEEPWNSLIRGGEGLEPLLTDAIKNNIELREWVVEVKKLDLGGNAIDSEGAWNLIRPHVEDYLLQLAKRVIECYISTDYEEFRTNINKLYLADDDVTRFISLITGIEDLKQWRLDAEAALENYIRANKNSIAEEIFYYQHEIFTESPEVVADIMYGVMDELRDQIGDEPFYAELFKTPVNNAGWTYSGLKGQMKSLYAVLDPDYRIAQTKANVALGMVTELTNNGEVMKAPYKINPDVMDKIGVEIVSERFDVSYSITQDVSFKLTDKDGNVIPDASVTAGDDGYIDFNVGNYRGEAYLTVYRGGDLEQNDYNFIKQFEVEFTDEIVRATWIKVTPSSYTVMPGGYAVFKAEVNPEATIQDTFNWASADENIATIESNGRVKGVSVGTTTISATTVDGSNLTATAKINVIDKEIVLGPLEAAYGVGRTMKIKGLTVFDEVYLEIVGPNGIVLFKGNVSRIDLENGVDIEIPYDATLGTYSVKVSKDDYAVEEETRIDKLDEIVLENISSDFKAGETVIIKGSTTLDNVLLQIFKPDGIVLYAVTVTKAELAEGVQITIPDDAMPGKYVVKATAGSIVSDPKESTVWTIIAVGDVDDVTVPYGTSKADVIGNYLPDTVEATYTDGTNNTTANVSVTWDSATYNATVPGTYEFIGKIAGTSMTASVNVTVIEGDYIILDSSIKDSYKVGETIIVKGRTSFDEVVVELRRPDNVAMYYASASKDEFEGEKVKIEIPLDAMLGDYTLIVSHENVAATKSIKITAAGGVNEVESLEKLSDVRVGIGTSENKVLQLLPKTVEATYTDGSKADLAITDWSIEEGKEYDNSEPGVFRYCGTVEGTDLKAEVQVIVTDIELDPSKKSIRVNNSYKFRIKVLPDDEYIEDVDDTVDIIWSSSNEKVATVDDEGTVKAKKTGTATITATVKNLLAEGDLTAKATVTVTSGGGGGGGITVRHQWVVGDFTVKSNNTATSAYINVSRVADTSKYPSTRPKAELLGAINITTTAKTALNYDLTISYKIKSYEPKYAYGIYRYNTTANAWEYVLTDVSENGASMTISNTTELGIYAAFREKMFEDLANHWANRDIARLYLQDMVKGYSETQFGPNLNITRAEFAAVVARMKGLKPIEGGASYPDAKGHWAEGYIAAMARSGYIKGYDDGLFRPDEKITREQIVAILVRATGVKAKEGVQVSIPDIDKVSPWFAEEMKAAVTNGFIAGYEDKTIRPLENATRAEAMVLAKRIFGL